MTSLFFLFLLLPIICESGTPFNTATPPTTQFIPRRQCYSGPVGFVSSTYCESYSQFCMRVQMPHGASSQIEFVSCDSDSLCMGLWKSSNATSGYVGNSQLFCCATDLCNNPTLPTPTPPQLFVPTTWQTPKMSSGMASLGFCWIFVVLFLFQ